jgi:5'-phosphate synthase pdxT subunit
MQLQIGVLAPQGGFEAYRKGIDEAYGDPVEAKGASDLAALDGLIVSVTDLSVLVSLLQDEHLHNELREFGQRKPILAVGPAACLLAAEGSILAERSLSLIDIRIDCSPNEPELENRPEMLRHELDDDSGALNAVFVHPPVIRWAGPKVTVLAKYNGNPVFVDQGLHMACTFQLELALDRRIFFHLVDKVRESYWDLRLGRR